MRQLRIIFSIIVFLLLISCSKEALDNTSIKEKSIDLQVMEAYNEGKEALENGDVLFAAKKFNEAETLFPQSDWAPKSALMAAYAYYIQNYYLNSIAELERFLRIYPNYKDIDYVYYLLGVLHYEQIIDEKKDLQSIVSSKKYFQILINNYPNTEYSIDAQFKIDYINDILAAKEMYIGRYYVQRKKWIPAINRFRNVIDSYDTTIYTEEALYRLVEIHYKVGLISEAKKYAKLLGYNYQSSQWYEQSYSLFNKKYNKKKLNEAKKIKKQKRSLIKKIKSLID